MNNITPKQRENLIKDLRLLADKLELNMAVDSGFGDWRVLDSGLGEIRVVPWQPQIDEYVEQRQTGGKKVQYKLDVTFYPLTAEEPKKNKR